jgi:acetyl-CoA C-acetyltransferase
VARIVATAQAADEFRYLARTPALAAAKALAKAGLEASEIDLWEINEAFASVTLQSIRMLGIEESRVNVNGGAIALGHPIGASGARILGALVHELRRRGGGLGCAAICSGGAQGDAVVVRV